MLGDRVTDSTSLPGDALGRWSTAYLQHRYPYGSLAWPGPDRDVTARDLGILPGKAVLLEVLDAMPGVPDGHEVAVDLDRLDAHVRSAAPVYYVYPVPPWSGQLDREDPWLIGSHRLHPEDLAFTRSGARWFGRWTYLCPAPRLQAHLRVIGERSFRGKVPGSWDWYRFWRRFVSTGASAFPGYLITATGPAGATAHGHALGEGLVELARRAERQRASEREAFIASQRGVGDLTCWRPTGHAWEHSPYERTEPHDVLVPGRERTGNERGPGLAVVTVPFSSFETPL